MLTYTPNIRVLNLSGNKITSFYRNIDNVASGGFSDALSVAKRAKERIISGHSTKTLKSMVQAHVLDKVAMKLQSQNRTKQVSSTNFGPKLQLIIFGFRLVPFFNYCCWKNCWLPRMRFEFCPDPFLVLNI